MDNLIQLVDIMGLCRCLPTPTRLLGRGQDALQAEDAQFLLRLDQIEMSLDLRLEECDTYEI